MTLGTLLRRGLTHYWRTNLAVIAGVGVAVSVLAGAFLVGTSVRASLRDLALLRLGRVDHVVTSGLFFREALADELLASGSLETAATDAVPMIAVEGFVTHQETGSRAGGIQVYGVDERFWIFHGLEAARAPVPGAVLVSAGLARELGAVADDTLLVRVQKPSAIPLSSLHGRREDLGRTMRLRIQQVLASDNLGEFSFRPQQGLSRAVFVTLGRMQRDLGLGRQANTILMGTGGAAAAAVDSTAAVAAIEAALREETRLDDLGVRVRVLEGRGQLVVESAAGLLSDDTVVAARAAAVEAGMTDQPILTYLANEIRFGDRVTPYSLVTAFELEAFGLDDAALGGTSTDPPPIVLNDWTADDLQAAPGDVISLQYYLWEDAGVLRTEEAKFRVAAIVPLEGLAADQDFAPEYPGITEATNVSDWDPPFPIDLDLVRPKDEDYWDDYRTAAKGFLPLAAGQDLWRSRWGQVTSLRVAALGEEGFQLGLRSGEVTSIEVVPPVTVSDEVAAGYRTALRSALDPLAAGFVVYPARGLALEAAAGVTDFSEYFTYFSFFLVVSALLLASLFFRLGVEQRLTEIGALRALGFDQTQVRRLFWAEGAVLSFAGSLLGVAGAVGYAGLIMWGLRTWWVDAVGTTLLTLHVSPLALAAGLVGGTLAAVLSIAWTLRAVAAATPRALISGSLPDAAGRTRRAGRGAGLARRAPVMLGLAGVAVLAATLAGVVGDTAGFFGAGMLLLTALLTLAWVLLGDQDARAAAVPSTWSVPRVGLRNATARPGRSVLCITLIAFAAFIIVAVDAFHLEGGGDTTDRTSGTGGYPLLAEALLPIVHDLSTEEGRTELGVAAFDDELFASAAYARFRVRPGEDTSCLNLYQAKDPRLLAPADAFVADGRFGFGSTMAETEAEAANPWLLLEREFADGAVPAIADATSLAYALHLSVGDDFILNRDTDSPITLRIVAALSDSIFQRELIIGEQHFVRLFPEYEGYRFFLVDVPVDQTAEVTAALEDRLADYGFDITSAPERLAAFHRVNNTYLATFQTLGALGLLLGTLGLGTVLLRNVLERRRELALLRAVGYNTRQISLMVLVENGLLLFGGLGAGTVCALVAIAPAWIERGGQFPIMSLGGLLLAVAVAGLVSSFAATIVAVRSPLLAALRSE